MNFSADLNHCCAVCSNIIILFSTDFKRFLTKIWAWARIDVRNVWKCLDFLRLFNLCKNYYLAVVGFSFRFRDFVIRFWFSKIISRSFTRFNVMKRNFNWSNWNFFKIQIFMRFFWWHCLYYLSIKFRKLQGELRGMSVAS